MALIIAIYAALAGTASAVVAVLSWRSGGPKVGVDAALGRIEVVSGGEASVLVVKATNRRRAEITIEHITVWGELVLPGHPAPIPCTMGFRANDPPFPHRLRAHDSAMWTAISAFDGSGPQIQASSRVEVMTATGVISVMPRMPVQDLRRADI